PCSATPVTSTVASVCVPFWSLPVLSGRAVFFGGVCGKSADAPDCAMAGALAQQTIRAAHKGLIANRRVPIVLSFSVGRNRSGATLYSRRLLIIIIIICNRNTQ